MENHPSEKPADGLALAVLGLPHDGANPGTDSILTNRDCRGLCAEVRIGGIQGTDPVIFYFRFNSKFETSP